MNTDNTDNNMTDEEFFALHPQPDLVVGQGYPTLIFPEDAEDEDAVDTDEDASILICAFPTKPEKYKRQYAVDLSGCPMNLTREFNKVHEEDDDLSDLPDLILMPIDDLPDLMPIDDLHIIRCPVIQARLIHKRAEERYYASLTTVDEIDEAIKKSLSRQYSILQDKEKQDPVQDIKDRNAKCFRTLEQRKDDNFRRL